MSYASRIIERFGGIAALAKAIDPNFPPTTVQYWGEIGRIPSTRQQIVLDAARKAGIELSPSDFFERP
jgi:hypothetical protein